MRALGLALQLGPAPTEQVLLAILQTARELACRQDADRLSALGPALEELVSQVHNSCALPPTAVMEVWATVANNLGALIGQLGLAYSISPRHRASIMDSVRSLATLLDEAAGSLFSLGVWIDQLAPGPQDAQAQACQHASLLSILRLNLTDQSF